MPTETLEIVADESKELLAVVQKNALPPAVAQSLQSSFAALFASARSIIEKSRGIVVTDASQKLETKLARECRLALRAVRLDGEKLHKTLKDSSRREGLAIDGVKNILLHLTETEEKRLQDQEDFAFVQEEKRKLALREARSLILTGLNIDPSLYWLADMDEAVFQQLVEGTRLARAAEAERLKKAEADRIAKDAADQAERERVRQENERLKAEKVAADAAAALERAEAARILAEQKRLADEAAAAERIRVETARSAAEVVAKAEREKVKETARKERLRLQALADVERQKAAAAAKLAADKAELDRVERVKIEAELRAAKDEQAARHAAQLEAERKAAAAPDRDKLLTYANAVRALEIPDFSTAEAKSLGTVIASQREKFALWLEEKAGGL